MREPPLQDRRGDLSTCEEPGQAGVACGRGGGGRGSAAEGVAGRGREVPAVESGWSCPWRRHRPWAPRPAAPYRARAEWPRGAGALPPAGGGRTGRWDRPGRGERCFSFTFLRSEAVALADKELRWWRMDMAKQSSRKE